MAERRTLVDGLKPVERTREEAFVFRGAPDAEPAGPPPTEKPAAGPAGRAPLTTRIRADLAAALKRASLERQLSGVRPNTVQEILEEALEPWMRAHGYLA